MPDSDIMNWTRDGIGLRTAEPDDVEALLGYLNHPDLAEDRQLGDRIPFPLAKEEVAKQLKEVSDTGRTLVIETEGVIIGHVEIDWWWDALAPGIGIAVDPFHRRRGHGRAAASMAIEYLFQQTPAHVVTAEVADWNSPGLAFAESMGFKRAGAFRRAVKRKSRWHEVVAFDLLRREWEAENAAR